MAIKKSDVYSSLWASCDQLRGGMDASQYKDYILVLLFIKYISDKYAGVPYAPITVPKGASFKDMAALKGKPSIGDDINKKIIAKIAEANKLTGVIDVADFNSAEKLGSGKEIVTKLSNLIAIFESPDLDFSANRADGDDILGDAYEYLMRNFATESGKSKGQFYTPAEVSRIMAKVIGVGAKSSPSTSVYDPTCGSGSLLLKVGEESENGLSLYGQEMDVATAGLARMNMILHNNPSAEIKRENTLSTPLFLDGNGKLKTFDYVVANPPFSFKSWTNDVNTSDDPFDRFAGYGVPPSKNGDYAFMLHILKSLKSKGKGAVILPHGVLFRGNAEAEIRMNVIRKGYIKGIIGLPANLFYGTGIPACIIVLDKENAENRKGIFIIDASKGFEKDGNKNRLREQDIHKIVDVFNKQLEIPKYSRMVSVSEIEEKEFNLNIPRYIDSQEEEDIQDIDAHLNGGIPDRDIDALGQFWEVYPSLKKELFAKSDRKGYSSIKVKDDAIRQTIFSHPEFIAYTKEVDAVFTGWRNKQTPLLKKIDGKTKPKKFIHHFSEDLLEAFSDLRLIDPYDVYQHLMKYWSETMQDDLYLIVSDGWKGGNELVWEKKDFEGKLIPKRLMINRYFSIEQKAIEQLESERDALTAQLEEMEEEHGGDDGIFSELEKINKANVAKRLKDIKGEKDADDDRRVLEQYLALAEKESEAGKKIKDAQGVLNDHLMAKYKSLSENDVKTLVVEDKWLKLIEFGVKNEMQRISKRLTQRVNELFNQYAIPLIRMDDDITNIENKVIAHLQKMGFVWK